MADEEGGVVKDADFAAWAAGLLVVLTLIVSVVSALGRVGVDFSDPKGSLERIRAGLGAEVFSDTTPLGTAVETIRQTEVWERAGGGNVLGVQARGARGELIGGPVTLSGVRWWDVDFEIEPDGWVEEPRLAIIEGGFGLILRLIVLSWQRFAVVISILALIGIVYSLWRINQIQKKTAEEIGLPDAGAFIPETQEVHNERWEHARGLADTHNPSDWRQAIIEADILLDELVTKMGYQGEGLGEKLKSIEKSDFVTLDKAWEAHKVRNRIAHDGSDFILTQRECRRVMGLFEEVFREFGFI